MSKRSAGVTVWAVLLILAGGLSLAGSVISSAVSGVMQQGGLEQRFQEMETQLVQAKGPDGQPLSPEQQAELRERLKAMQEKMAEFFSSPMMKFTTVLHGLLGLAALIAGIGLLMLKGWARFLTVWQAIGAIVVGLFAQMTMHAWQQEVLQSIVAGAPNAAQQEAMQKMMQTAQVFGLGLGIVLLVGWNGLLIWFFNRASVKAQFTGQPA